MDNSIIQLFIFIIGGGFTILFGLIIIVWNNLSKLIKELRDHASKTDVRLAVIETKLTDLNANVQHLMWRDQIITRDVAEE